MLEKGRISGLQMSLLMYANIISTGILLLPGNTFEQAGRDMWISPMWGSLSGFLTVWIAYRLNRFYPSATLIQCSQHILGRLLGKAVGFFYLFLYLYVGGTTLRQYGDFLVGAFLNYTPLLMVMGCLALASAFAVRAGLEVLARLSDIFTPIMILLWLIIVLLLLPELEIKQMLPILEDGIKPSLQGSVAILNLNSLYFFIFSLLPFVVDRQNGLKWGMYSVLAATLTLVMTNLAALLLFGSITGNFVYPVMNAARYISYADFFENLEALVMAIWIGGTFIKVGLIHYLLAMDTAHWLDLSDYKPLALPMGLLLTCFGIWLTPNLPELTRFLGVINPYIGAIFYILIPVALLVIAALRNEKRS